MNVAYISFSSEQDKDQQIKVLQKYHIEQWHEDKVTEKDTNRPGLKYMLDYVRDTDTVYVEKMSRLASSTKEVDDIIEKIRGRKAGFKSIMNDVGSATELVGKRYAYIRVSTVDQNEGRQKEALKDYDIDTWYEEKVSGKDMNRPQLKALLDVLGQHDIVYVEEFSRLGRSTTDLKTIIAQIEAKGAKFVSIRENFDLSTANGRLQMNMMAALAEFERDLILERQREGIALAKAQGKYKGRKVKKIDDIGKYYEQYMRREGTQESIAKTLGISRQTLAKLFKEYKENLKNE